jgi:hypothetical protein
MVRDAFTLILQAEGVARIRDALGRHWQALTGRVIRSVSSSDLYLQPLTFLDYVQSELRKEGIFFISIWLQN